MKIFTLSTKTLLLFLLAVCLNTTAVNSKRRTINELKSDLTSQLQKVRAGKTTTKGVIQSISLAPNQQYLLDSINFKDITLSEDVSAEARFELIYDNQGRVIQELSKEYDSFTEEMVVTFKSVYQYSSKTIIRTDYEYTSDSTYYTNIKTNYDNDGKILTIQYSTDSINTSNTYKTETYVYNQNLLQKIESMYTGAISLGEKSEFYYGTASRLDSSLTYVRNEADSLIFDTKTTYTYDNADNLLNQTDYYWDNEWILLSTSDYTFNSANNCTNMKYTEEIMEGFFVNVDYKFSYNTDVLSSDVSSGSALIDYTFPYTNQITKVDITTSIDDMVLSNYRFDMFYSAKTETALINNTLNNDIRLIYNSATKTFIVVNADKTSPVKIQLFDITGKYVWSNNTDLNVNGGLKKGIYVYKLTQNIKTTSAKLIVE